MYKNLEERLRKAIDICNINISSEYPIKPRMRKSQTNNFSLIYPFTTENINGYIENFDFNDKSLLSVGSSGDQVINAILFGCKDITLIDICPYAKYYFFFKKSAILTLNRKEFLTFMEMYNKDTYVDNVKSQKREILVKILKKLEELDYESYLFWGSLFTRFSSTNDIIKIRKIFNSIKTSYEFNPYLKSDEQYNNVKENIEDIKSDFIEGDITKVNINKKFDNIIMSNLCGYYDNNEYKAIFDKINNNLNTSGKMLLYYIYKTETNIIWNKVFQEEIDEIFKIFDGYNLSRVDFEGVQGIYTKFGTVEVDTALIYQKH